MPIDNILCTMYKSIASHAWAPYIIICLRTRIYVYELFAQQATAYILRKASLIIVIVKNTSNRTQLLG